jgi:hypothetical protein
MSHPTGTSGQGAGDDSGAQQAQESSQGATSDPSGAQESRSVPIPGSEETRSVTIPEKITGNVVISTKEGEGQIRQP